MPALVKAESNSSLSWNSKVNWCVSPVKFTGFIERSLGSCLLIKYTKYKISLNTLLSRYYRRLPQHELREIELSKLFRGHLIKFALLLLSIHGALLRFRVSYSACSGPAHQPHCLTPCPLWSRPKCGKSYGSSQSSRKGDVRSQRLLELKSWKWFRNSSILLCMHACACVHTHTHTHIHTISLSLCSQVSVLSKDRGR